MFSTCFVSSVEEREIDSLGLRKITGSPVLLATNPPTLKTHSTSNTLTDETGQGMRLLGVVAKH